MLGQMKLNFRAQREFRQVSTPSTLWAAQACGRAAFSWLGVAGVAPALVTTRPSTTTGSEGAAGERRPAASAHAHAPVASAGRADGGAARAGVREHVGRADDGAAASGDPAGLQRHQLAEPQGQPSDVTLARRPPKGRARCAASAWVHPRAVGQAASRGGRLGGGRRHRQHRLGRQHRERAGLGECAGRWPNNRPAQGGTGGVSELMHAGRCGVS
jgi:hypothetical protein